MVQIGITIATDTTWHTYWNPPLTQWRNHIRKALREFTKHFPEVEFILHQGKKDWDSLEVPLLTDFPLSLLWNIPNTLTTREVVKELMQRMEDLGIDGHEIVEEEEQERIARTIEHSKKEDQLAYLEGYFGSSLIRHFLRDLIKAFPVPNREFVFGFTGKVMAPRRNFACQGVAIRNGNHAMFPIMHQWLDPWRIILHEFGHTMGAEHPEDHDMPSIMNAYIGESLEFDQENIKRIQERIAKL